MSENVNPKVLKLYQKVENMSQLKLPLHQMPSAILVPPKVENVVKKSTTIKSDLTEDRKSKNHGTSSSTSVSVTI